ncbi:MAG: Hsp33 family molecular chaperone HslO [Clostridiaceae bacterium]|jgi:molecular chaperone Hsp33|nr:Hsp33 family molecular chaperone HslO [Clostridiaceae bacterium]
MKDYIIRGASTDDSIRFFCCITTAMVEEARKIHNCSPVSIAALGRMLTAGSMMGTMLKSDKDTITLQINGKGPAGNIVVISDNTGNARGYITNPDVELMQHENGKLDVGRAVGRDGVVTVIKDMGMKEPYVGQIPIVSGEIGDDISSYFVTSEQVPTAVGLGVLVEVDGHVAASGGFIIQLMPEAEPVVISKLEERLGRIRSVTEMISSGLDAEGMIKNILENIEYKIFDSKQVGYKCSCSKERMEKALISIGKKELEELIQEQGGAELTCHFCSNKYYFDKDELIKLFEKASISI